MACLRPVNVLWSVAVTDKMSGLSHSACREQKPAQRCGGFTYYYCVLPIVKQSIEIVCAIMGSGSQEFFSGVGGCSTNSVEDRERGSGGVAP